MMTELQDDLFELIGQWQFIRADKDTFDQTGVTITFDEEGQLTYKINSRGKTQIIKLTYRIENEWLITDQPSDPQEERTRFQIMPSGELILDFEGTKSWYQKI